MGERALWWAVLRQAVHDMRYGPDSTALDGMEFLRGTGEWIAGALFGIPSAEYRREVIDVLLRRNRSRGKELSVGNV